MLTPESTDRTVYLDNAATTPLHASVRSEMNRAFYLYGNPSSIHGPGRAAKEYLEDARDRLARIVGADPGEIIFTGGGSEADNLALLGYAIKHAGRGRHAVTSPLEHPAVKNALAFLELVHDFEVTVLPVDEYGLVMPADLEAALRPDTVLATVMYANNEIGTLEPVSELARVCADREVFFHTDAVQAFCKIPFTAPEVGMDAYAAAAHKIHGPKGVGFLYLEGGATDETGARRLFPLVHGGGQESSLRAGTENVAGVAGLVKAAEILAGNPATFAAEVARQEELRDRITREVLAEVDGAYLNGHPERRLPNIVNVGLPGIDGPALALALDEVGICVSTGAACHSDATVPSAVLRALGRTPVEATQSIRVSVGKFTTDEDVDYLLEQLPGAVRRVAHA